MIFKVLDYSQTPVILSEETWFDKLLDPIFGHPEIKPFLSQIKTTVKNPELVYQSIRDPRSKLSFSKIRKGSFKSYYLAVVIKYIKEGKKTIGYISTAMINRELPKKSKLIWERNLI